eukprot:snap_masked-scaffold_28-processed-gene-3.63-mRNA-1 protein AED:0.13 eAED:0.14 QI:0/-1/0/1/-1/1/1/0/415
MSFLSFGGGKKANGTGEKVEQTVQASIGDRIWVSKKKDEDYSRLWELYSVASLSADKRKVFVADNATKNIWEVPAEETLPYDPCHIVDYDDLTRMNYLHEASLLNRLQERYMENKIYTYFGDTLLSINPYFDVEGLYSKDRAEEAKKEPHVFSIAEKIFSLLQKKRQSQSIVINGDSESGKTETAKQLMRHLVYLCLNNSSKTAPEIESLVLKSTPVLEAFGNSVILRNGNSSRFGNFIQIIYSDKGDAITGVNTMYFLLEKPRIIQRSPRERSYHILYQCCAALTDMGFRPASAYNDLLPELDSNNYTAVLPDDLQMFKRTSEALEHIEVGQSTQNEIWRLLLAILTLGNIGFVTSQDDMHNNGKCQVADDCLLELETAAEKLNIANAQDLEIALTQKTIEAGNEKTSRLLWLT